MPYEDTDPPKCAVHATLKKVCGTCNINLGCVANAHHFYCGSSYTNVRGESIFNLFPTIILKYLMSLTLKLFSREVIDITTSNMDDSAISNWKKSEKCFFSEHKMIFFQVDEVSDRNLKGNQEGQKCKSPTSELKHDSQNLKLNRESSECCYKRPSFKLWEI